jgi:Flp pilus assembly pilin Flp
MCSKGSMKNHHQRGAALVEYSLLVALISIVSITSASRLGRSVNCTFQNAMTGIRLGSYSPFCTAEYSGDGDLISGDGTGTGGSGTGDGVGSDGGID